MKKDKGIIINYLNFLEFNEGFEVDEMIEYFKKNFIIEHLRGVIKMKNIEYSEIKKRHLEFSNKFSEVLQYFRPEFPQETKEPITEIPTKKFYLASYFYKKLGVSGAAYKKWKTKYQFKETGSPKKRMISIEDIERFLNDNEKYRAAWGKKD